MRIPIKHRCIAFTVQRSPVLQGTLPTYSTEIQLRHRHLRIESVRKLPQSFGSGGGGGSFTSNTAAEGRLDVDPSAFNTGT